MSIASFDASSAYGRVDFCDVHSSLDKRHTRMSLTFSDCYAIEVNDLKG